MSCGLYIAHNSQLDYKEYAYKVNTSTTKIKCGNQHGG